MGVRPALGCDSDVKLDCSRSATLILGARPGPVRTAAISISFSVAAPNANIGTLQVAECAWSESLLWAVQSSYT